MAIAPGAARADGDPASDVLVSQNLFLPWDAGVGAGQQAQLEGVLQTAARGGYPVRVALIGSASDLGSVTQLWRRPASYAQFLGEELSLVYRGRVLVVMPSGFGLFDPGRTAPAEQAALAQVRLPARVGLATAAITAVERLAAAAGHRLLVSSSHAYSSSRSTTGSGSGDTTSWIVFAVGGAVIALAWIVSLRVAPVRVGDRGASSV